MAGGGAVSQPPECTMNPFRRLGNRRSVHAAGATSASGHRHAFFGFCFPPGGDRSAREDAKARSNPACFAVFAPSRLRVSQVFSFSRLVINPVWGSKPGYLSAENPTRRRRHQTPTSIHFTEGNEGNKGRGHLRVFVLFVLFGKNSAVENTRKKTTHSEIVNKERRNFRNIRFESRVA